MILERKGGGGKERNRDRLPLVRPLAGMEPASLWCTGPAPTKCATGPGLYIFLMILLITSVRKVTGGYKIYSQEPNGVPLFGRTKKPRYRGRPVPRTADAGGGPWVEGQRQSRQMLKDFSLVWTCSALPPPPPTPQRPLRVPWL